MKKHRNFIHGTWVAPATNEWIDNKNPATGESLGSFPRSGSNDIAAATAAARQAFKPWRNTPAPVRAEFLQKAADVISAHREEFARDLCREMGKPWKECLADVQEAIDMARFSAGEGRRNLGMVTSSELPNRTVMAFREPAGIVGAITPWNYPMAMPAWKVMPALIAGNTAILKPAEDTPCSALNLARAFEAAELPPGVFNVVVGIGEEAGQALVGQEGVNVISFTGSTRVGTMIAEQCPQQHKRVALEMGGKNAVLVLADADLNLAATGIIRSVFATSGQRCSSAGRIIAEESIVAPLTELLLKATKKLVIGNGMDPDTDLGPIINEVRLAHIEAAVAEALEQGAQALCGGERAVEGVLEQGFFYQPTLLDHVSPDMPIAQKETFGPVASILRARDIHHALEIANGVDYGLTSAIFTRDINKALFMAKNIEVGSFFVNTACVGAEINLPFGGLKGSGNGRREGAHHALDIYTEWKTVSIQGGVDEGRAFLNFQHRTSNSQPPMAFHSAFDVELSMLMNS